MVKSVLRLIVFAVVVDEVVHLKIVNGKLRLLFYFVAAYFLFAMSSCTGKV
jgi:hypothetical protein